MAQELDREEHRLLKASTSKQTGNVDGLGNFSSQVLFRALQRWGNLSAVDSRHENVRSDISRLPERETGYICNLRKHWVALRKVPWHGGKDTWFNLNSHSATGPTVVAESWLASFLASASADRDTVFVVRGKYCEPNPEAFKEPLEGHQMFLDEVGLQRLRVEEERVAAQVRQALKLADGPALEAEAPNLPGQVPDPWRVVWSDKEVSYYYWNTISNITQWEHPSQQSELDLEVLGRLMDIALAGAWQVLLPELAAAEFAVAQPTATPKGTVPAARRSRYVDHVPPDHGQCLLHLAAAQGQAWVVQRLLEDFGAQPQVRSFEGKTATEIAWSAGHAAVLGVLLGGPVPVQAVPQAWVWPAVAG